MLSVKQYAARGDGHEVFQHLDKALTWVTEGLPTADGQSIAIRLLLLELNQLAARNKN